jgi:hypothetical protein
LPAREVDLRNGVGLEDGCVVDEDVYPTHLARDALDKGARGARVGHVGREGRVRPALKGGERLLGRLPVCAVVDRHPRFLLRELTRYLASYAARGARHQRHLPREFHPFPHPVASPTRAALSSRRAALPLVAGASRRRQPKAATPARIFPEPGFSLVAKSMALWSSFVEVDPFAWSPSKARETFETGIRDAAERGLVPVLSAERLSGNPDSGGYDSVHVAEYLAATFPEARVLIVIREQADMLVSSYKRYVRNGGPGTLRQYGSPPWGPRALHTSTSVTSSTIV